MPLSQAISDTDCIMRDYNQLTAAGSYGERMILNRNQYKLNLTLSPAEQSSELGTREGSSDGSGGFRVGQGVLGQAPSSQVTSLMSPCPRAGGLNSLPHPYPPSAFLTSFPLLPPALSLSLVDIRSMGLGFSQDSFIQQCWEQSHGPVLTLPAPASSAASGDHSVVANVLWW